MCGIAVFSKRHTITGEEYYYAHGDMIKCELDDEGFSTYSEGRIGQKIAVYIAYIDGQILLKYGRHAS